MTKELDDSNSGGGLLIHALVGVVALAVGAAAGFVVGDKRGKSTNASAVADASRAVEAATASERSAIDQLAGRDETIKSMKVQNAELARRLEVAITQMPPATAEKVEKDNLLFHDAKNPVRFGDAKIELLGALVKKGKDYNSILVLLSVQLADDARPFKIKGYGADIELAESLTGEIGIAPGELKPLDIKGRMTLKDETEKIYRPIMRVMVKKGRESVAKIREANVASGDVYTVSIQFEHPDPGFKMLFLDLDAEDFGTSGRIRFKLPSSMVVKNMK